MSERLIDIERENARRIAKLQAAGANRTLIAELLETSCLLELARLGTARLDLLSYLQACTDVITQVFTVAGAGIEVQPHGAPAAVVWSGEAIESHALAERHRITVDGTDVGTLLVGRMTADLANPRFFMAAAEMIGRGVGVIAETEALKRNASAASAMRAASKLGDDEDVETQLNNLVEALAKWPGAVAAHLYVDHPAIGSPVRVRAGFWESDGVERPLMERATFGAFMQIRWESPEEQGSTEDFDAVVEALNESFARMMDEKRLRNEIETDPLTRLGNRRRLEAALDGSVVRARRFGERLALVMCDLDHFKKVNDTLGHDMGDVVLKTAADVLRSSVRGYDIVCRIGGEEFVIICPQTDQVAAMALGERIRAELPRRCATQLPTGWHQTTSIGVAVFPDHADDPTALLKVADVALYRAKSGGRDAVVMGIPEASDSTKAASTGADSDDVAMSTADDRRKRPGGIGRIFGR
ncbi:MAG: GGDEF domain-containing protein [Acidimicrobiia bacterium]